MVITEQSLTNETRLPLPDEDGYKLMADGMLVDNVKVIDLIPPTKAHIDAFQIIPPSARGEPNDQYRLGAINDLTITNCEIYTAGTRQGIFMSDGLLGNVNIDNIVVETNSAHKVAINGLLGGSITNVRDSNGILVPAILRNARIGGGQLNIMVSSFSDIEYEEVYGNVTDLRGSTGYDNVVSNLEYFAFRDEVAKITFVNLDTHLNEVKGIVKRLTRLT